MLFAGGIWTLVRHCNVVVGMFGLSLGVTAGSSLKAFLLRGTELSPFSNPLLGAFTHWLDLVPCLNFFIKNTIRSV